MSKFNINGFVEEVINNGTAEILARRIRESEFQVNVGSVKFETGKIETNDTEAVIGYYIHEAIKACNSPNYAIDAQITHSSDCICSVEFTHVTKLH